MKFIFETDITHLVDPKRIANNISTSPITHYPPVEFKGTLFKHMLSEHAESMMLKGEILISSVKSYKDVANKEIEDKSEAMKFLKWTQTGESFTINKDGSRTKYNNDGIIQFLKPTFKRPVSYIDQYTYCLSLSDDNTIFPNYNACIKIFDVKGLAKEIYRELLKKGVSKAGASGARILYKENKDVPLGDKIPAYWIKEIKNSYQQEYRFIFPSKIERKRENLNVILPSISVSIKDISKYCERIR